MAGSSPVVGSSRRRTAGLATSSKAMLTRFRCSGVRCVGGRGGAGHGGGGWRPRPTGDRRPWGSAPGPMQHWRTAPRATTSTAAAICAETAAAAGSRPPHLAGGGERGSKPVVQGRATERQNHARPPSAICCTAPSSIGAGRLHWCCTGPLRGGRARGGVPGQPQPRVELQRLRHCPGHAPPPGYGTQPRPSVCGHAHPLPLYLYRGSRRTGAVAGPGRGGGEDGGMVHDGCEPPERRGRQLPPVGGRATGTDGGGGGAELSE